MRHSKIVKIERQHSARFALNAIGVIGLILIGDVLIVGSALGLLVALRLGIMLNSMMFFVRRYAHPARNILLMVKWPSGGNGGTEILSVAIRKLLRDGMTPLL